MSGSFHVSRFLADRLPLYQSKGRMNLPLREKRRNSNFLTQSARKTRQFRLVKLSPGWIERPICTQQAAVIDWLLASSQANFTKRIINVPIERFTVLLSQNHPADEFYVVQKRGSTDL